ncbi:hypothetical protein EV175_002174 [Coemansia sp. RSA 1933]|nr:hypothetical protein EV175_002174 [Coemansia sp. RSA 1933]
MSLQVQPVARRITAVAWLPPHAGTAYNDADLHFVTGSGGKHRELVLWTTANPDFTNHAAAEEETQETDERPLASLVSKVAHDGDILGTAAASADIVATVSSFGTISIYHADRSTAGLTLRESVTAHRFANGEPAPATALSVQPVDSPDAEVASCGEDGRIAYARASRLDALQYHEVDSTVITGICWPTRAQTAVSTRAGQVKLFDRRSPTQVSAVIVSPASYSLECIATHPSQSFRLATGTDQGAVLLWDTRNLKSPAMEVFNVHAANVWDVKFDPSDASRIVSCSDDATLAVTQWSSSSSAPDVSNERAVRRISSFFNVMSVNCLDVCPFTRSSVIVAGSDSGNLLIEKSPASPDEFNLF